MINMFKNDQHDTLVPSLLSHWGQGERLAPKSPRERVPIVLPRMHIASYIRTVLYTVPGTVLYSTVPGTVALQYCTVLLRKGEYLYCVFFPKLQIFTSLYIRI